MKRPLEMDSEIWRTRAWVWLTPLSVVIAGILALTMYQIRFAGGVAALEERSERISSVLDEARQRRERAEDVVTRAEEQREALQHFYSERLATESERFTGVLREVRTLARRAGLDPASFAYPESQLDSYGLVKRNVNFSVSGTYEQLRTFINMLELSDEFIALELVSLSGGDVGGRLSISLSISSYFREDPDAPHSGRRSS